MAQSIRSRRCTKLDDRRGFIRRACEVAAGRELFFKLHPNENVQRACAEIVTWAPEARIFADGPTPADTRKLTEVFPYNDLFALMEALDDQVACVILEPMIFEQPEADYLRLVKRAARSSASTQR